MNDRFVLSAISLRAVEFGQRIEAAARAGFSGIGLDPAQYDAALGDGWTPSSMLAALAGLGLVVDEVIWLDGWWRADRLDKVDEDFTVRVLTMANALGARYIVAVGDVADSIATTGLRFGTLCDRAASAGVGVGLEYTWWRGIGRLDVALDVVAAAGRPNGGIVVDPWHVFRAGDDPAALRDLSADVVLGVQLNDGVDRVHEPPADSLRARRPPGEGEFDLVTFVRSLDLAGVRAPVAVEVASDALTALDPFAVAERLMAGTRAVIEQSRQPGG
jgi:sugar phosphate isomerase/epimerase